MTTINLKDYYPWYLTNEYIEVTDEVAEALMASKRAEAAHAERVRYNRAYYSLDCDDGIEYSACVHEPSPQELLGAGLVNTGGVFDPVITVQGIISPVVAHPLRMGGLGPLAGHERLGHFIGDFDILIG